MVLADKAPVLQVQHLVPNQFGTLLVELVEYPTSLQESATSGTKSIWNSTCRAGGIPDKSSGKTSGKSLTIDTSSSHFLSDFYLASFMSSAQATSPAPAPIKAVESNCVTCGDLRNIQSQGQSTQTQCQNIQNQYQTVQNQLANLTDMMSKFMSSNMASSSGSATLPGNTVTNPKEDLKGITARSGVAYKGPTILTPSKVVKQGTEATKDPVQTPSPQSTAHVQPPVTQSKTSVSETIVAPVSTPMPNLKPLIPYPLRHDDERRREQANE
nr:hypothetical protein [Tanacetum cinerariifolium]